MKLLEESLRKLTTNFLEKSPKESIKVAFAEIPDQFVDKIPLDLKFFF